MRLHLAQAFSNRAPRGRKHDFKDAERLVRRLIANELILSFVPSGERLQCTEEQLVDALTGRAQPVHGAMLALQLGRIARCAGLSHERR
jgi:hypothetical protein